MAQLSNVLTTARSYLNDDNATTWTDQILIPKAQEAFREVQNKLWTVGAQICRAQSIAFAIAPNVNPTDITALFSDMQSPISIQETSSPATIWTPMTEATYFPADYPATNFLTYWSWQEERLLLAPCTANRVIVVNYRRVLPLPTVSGSQLFIPFAELYMGARTAAIAAGSVGNADVFTAMSAKAKENLGKVIAANRGQQKPSMRP